MFKLLFFIIKSLFMPLDEFKREYIARLILAEKENEILKRLDEKEDEEDEIAGIKVPLKNLL